MEEEMRWDLQINYFNAIYVHFTAVRIKLSFFFNINFIDEILIFFFFTKLDGFELILAYFKTFGPAKLQLKTQMKTFFSPSRPFFCILMIIRDLKQCQEVANAAYCTKRYNLNSFVYYLAIQLLLSLIMPKNVSPCDVLSLLLIKSQGVQF